MTRRGLTLLEVLVALAILGAVFGMLSLTLITSLRQAESTGLRTQAVQILNYVGRRIVGGEVDLPSFVGYGELRGVFPDLPREVRHANPDRYRVEVRRRGAPNWARPLKANVEEYEVAVCWKEVEGERCVSASTYSSPPSGKGRTPPPLPGIN